MMRRRRLKTTGNSWEYLPVLGLLILAVLVPTVCVLWFMGQAVRNEQLAVRQRLTEVYLGELRNVREHLGNHWSDTLDALADIESDQIGLRFVHAVQQSGADGALIFDTEGRLVYPQTFASAGTMDLTNETPQWQAAEALEHESGDFALAADRYAQIARQTTDVSLSARSRRGQVRCLMRAGNWPEALRVLKADLSSGSYSTAVDVDGRYIEPGAELLVLELLRKQESDTGQPTNTLEIQQTATKLVARLNDYSDPLLPSSQRRFLMHELLKNRAIYSLGDDPDLFPTRHAEDLSAAFLESNTSFTTASHPARTAQPNLWQIRSADGTVLALYKTETIRQIVQRIVENRLKVADIRIDVAPDVTLWRDQPFMTLAAEESMPDWSLGLFVDNDDPFALAEKRQQSIYLWTGVMGIASVGLVVGLMGRHLFRQMRLAQLKNDFVATVTHELKTPLASMRLLTDTLLEGRYREEKQVREYLQLVSRENERLSRLIDNFLTFSRMERNKRVFVFQPVSAGLIVDITTASVRERLEAAGFELTVNVEPDMPSFSADRDAIITVLVNLIDNACKYSEDEKKIAVRVSSADHRICFEVEDRGIGMSAREVKRIFNRFYQADQRLIRKAGGCGLGLSIVKFIVDGHGGTIEVESEPGKGSRFRIMTPVFQEKKDVVGNHINY